jgi:hypothetical protein
MDVVAEAGKAPVMRLQTAAPIIIDLVRPSQVFSLPPPSAVHIHEKHLKACLSISREKTGSKQYGVSPKSAQPEGRL